MNIRTTTPKPAAGVRAVFKYTLLALTILSGLTSGFIRSASDQQPAEAAHVEPRIQHHVPRYHGKPSAPVTLDYSLPKQILPGQTFDLTLEFHSATQQGRMQVAFNVEGHLSLLSPPGAENEPLEFSLSAAEKRTTLLLQATALGSAYIHVQVIETDLVTQSKQARAITIPVVIGEQNLKSTHTAPLPKDSTLRTEGDSEPIIEMPAQMR